jgi:hypothetical protein
MIVNNTLDGWEVIYQRAHGLLAAEIGQHWKSEERPEKWIETLIAISDHDDSQQYWHEKHHLTKQGTPEDFQLQPPDLIQAKRVVEASKFKSAWISLLISTHVGNLYDNLESKNKEIKDFLHEQTLIRKKLLKELKHQKIELEEAYRLLYWCDRISLILCKNQVPPDEKSLEIAEGPNGVIYYILQRKDGTLEVSPWPFVIQSFKVEIETRQITTVVFKDDEALHKTLEATPITSKTWNFKKK